ncbi:unnamed protein product [Paramecium octaurelia]|uniref:Uncharacterized protein n=1 Tax=Paramecium octaurelia TaxID=43137 RepID=A0A8S1X9Q3_PAROT|nr:unnamed protein product [Paramecium octaurelia]
MSLFLWYSILKTKTITSEFLNLKAVFCNVCYVSFNYARRLFLNLLIILQNVDATEQLTICKLQQSPSTSPAAFQTTCLILRILLIFLVAHHLSFELNIQLFNSSMKLKKDQYFQQNRYQQHPVLKIIKQYIFLIIS